MVIAKAALFSQSFVSHRYTYVIFDRNVRHVSIQFSKVNLYARQQSKNPLSTYLDEGHVLLQLVVIMDILVSEYILYIYTYKASRTALNA
jgi:hypothetical protein